MKLSWTFNRAMGKRYLWVPLILTLIISMTPAIVPVHAGHTNEHFWVEPAVKYGETPDLTYFNVSVWVENAWDMVGWAMSVHVDPDVLEVLGSSAGTFLQDFVDAWNADNPGAEVSLDFYTGAVDKEGGYIIDTDSMIVGYWKIPDGQAANGSGMLCQYWFKTKSEQNLTAYSLIDLFDVRVYDHDIELYIENVTDGHYNEPPVGEDAAVINIVASESQGYPTWTTHGIDINVTVLNNGSAPDFNVTAYYGSTWYEIGTQPVTNLTEGANTTLTFNWNLSGVAHGVYDIKANATLEGDTYLDNNEVIVYDAVKVKMEGDVDGNNYVGSWDLILLADAYGSDPGEPNWNRQADFNDDTHVGSEDFVWLAVKYGQSY